MVSDATARKVNSLHNTKRTKWPVIAGISTNGKCTFVKRPAWCSVCTDGRKLPCFLDHLNEPVSPEGAIELKRLLDDYLEHPERHKVGKGKMSSD